ncbi:MAG: metal ABC transporter permease [Fimbriimonadaceae bacterium]
MSSTAEIFVAAALAAVGCSLAGVFLVLRRESMLAEALSHAILPGLVFGYWLVAGPSLIVGSLGALLAAIAATAVILVLSVRFKISRDASIAFTFSAFFAFGVLLITAFFSNVHLDLDAVLFGELLLTPFERMNIGGHDVGPRAWWVFGSLMIVQSAFLYFFCRSLKVASFDPTYAALIGFSPMLLGGLYLVMLSTAAVAAFSAVGAILSIALIVAPVASARLLSNRIPKIIVLSIVFALLAAWAGTAVAFALDVSLSGMIALTLGTKFILVAVLSPRKGLLGHAIKSKRLQLHLAEWSLLKHLSAHQDDEEEECTLSHIHEVFGWRRSKLRRTLFMSKKHGWVEVAGDQLRITEKGKERVLQPVYDPHHFR